MTRPSVTRYAASAVHSAQIVGFDIAKTIGRGLISPMALSTESVNNPPWPERPMSAVGRRARTAASRSGSGGCVWA